MRVVVSGDSGKTALQLRPLVNGLGLECAATDCVALDNLRLRLSSGSPVDLVLVRAGDDQVAALLAVQHSVASRIPVLVVGKAEPDFQDQTRKAGARGWVEEASFRDQLLAALDTLYRDGAVRVKRGRLIAVTAASSGNGVTTTATALAFALAADSPNEVGLAELGSDVPELALNLDLTVRHSLANLIHDWERSDAHMAHQVAVRHDAGGLHVLAYPSETLTASPMVAPQMRHLAVLLREMFGQVVLDLGHSATPAVLEALGLAEAVVVVVRPEVPALRLARAYMLHLRDQGIPLDRIRPLINRAGYRHQVEKREVERLLGKTPLEWVQDDPGTVIGALSEGKPLIQYYPRARITRTFRHVAKLLEVPTPK